MSMFKYVHHVHYVVQNRDAMIDYLQKNFGMKPDFVGVNHNGNEARYNIDKTQLQICEPSDPNSSQGRFLAKNGPGLYHVAWGIDDIEKVAQTLVANGNKIEHAEKGFTKSEAHDYVVCNLAAAGSPVGVRLQLVEE